jgi:pimeloyl-ACP methyl ester carboxylesterase
MRQIYCISGLGADFRLYRNLILPGCTLLPLNWIKPENGDDMASYARKLTEQIKVPDPIIIGMSLGGMMAVEIARQHPDWQVFIVSSAKTKMELGYGNGIVKWLGQKEPVLNILLKFPDFALLRLLGADTPEKKELIRVMLSETPKGRLIWSMKAILDWGSTSYTTNIIHLHGTFDKVIRPAHVHPDHWIEGGSHVMVYDRAEEVAEIIAGHIPA